MILLVPRMAVTRRAVMAPVFQSKEHERPPTNIAQAGMGWHIITWTIDLGLGIFDALILAQEGLYDWARKKAEHLKENEIKRRGRKNLPSTKREKRSVIPDGDEFSVQANWV